MDLRRLPCCYFHGRPGQIAGVGAVLKISLLRCAGRPQNKDFRGFHARGRTAASSSGFYRAGVPAKQGIGRAPVDKPGGQGHDAGPAPQFDRVGSGQLDQNQANGDAKNAVDATDIGFHG